MASIAIATRIPVVDINGDPIEGAKIYFFDAGTTTPKVVFTDAGLTTPHTSPIICDASGRAPLIYIDPTEGDYKIRINGADDVLVFEDDQVSPLLSTPVSIVNGGTGATTAAGARSSLDVPSTITTDSLNTRITDLETIESKGTVWDYNAQPYSATFIPNINAHNAVSTTLTGDILIEAPTGAVDGKMFIVKILQDATGNRKVTLSSDYKTGDLPMVWPLSPNTTATILCQFVTSGEIQVLKSPGYPYWSDIDKGVLQASQLYTQPHSLGRTPYRDEYQAYLKCTASDVGRDVDSTIELSGISVGTVTGDRKIEMYADIDNVYVIVTSSLPFILNPTTQTSTEITASKWKVFIRFKAFE